MIKRRRGTVAIVGLGYVGLPLACLAAEKGWRVVGVTKTARTAELVNRGLSPVRESRLARWLKKVKVAATTDFSAVRTARFIAVCVPTPVDDNYYPDLRPLKNACEQLSRNLRRGQTVIIESTVNPGVCEEVVLPILERSGLRVGSNVLLAHCPERIDPGNKRWTVRNIPRVIGATSARGLRSARLFYESIIEAPVRSMQTIKEAEAVKILENSFRDVNIAFVNEMARSFVRLGIDTLDVIAGAQTKPFAFLVHYPSIGVGGHCIPVDPYYLIERARRSGFNHEFLKLAREINNSMPAYALDLLVRALDDKKRALRSVRVGILGVAYKADVADTRESPAYPIMKLLASEYGAKFDVYDPYVPEQSTVASVKELFERCQALILVTDHKVFRDIRPRDLKRSGVIAVVDGKNALDKDAIQRLGISYRGIGR